MHRYKLTTTGPKGGADTSPHRPLADRTIHTDRAGTSLDVWEGFPVTCALIREC